MSIYDNYKAERTRMDFNNYIQQYLPYNLTKDDLYINNIPYGVLRVEKVAEKLDSIKDLTVNGKPYLDYIYNEGKYDCIVNMQDVLKWYTSVTHRKAYISNIGGMLYYVKAKEFPLHSIIVYEFADEEVNIGYGISASVPYMIENAKNMTRGGFLQENPFENLDSDIRVGMMSMVIMYVRLLFRRQLKPEYFTGITKLTLLDNDTIDFRLNSYDYEKMMENPEKLDKLSIRDAFEYDNRFGIFFRTNLKGTVNN